MKHSKRTTDFNKSIPLDPILKRAEELLVPNKDELNGQHLRRLLQMAADQSWISDDLTDAALSERFAVDLATFTILHSLLATTLPKDLLQDIVK